MNIAFICLMFILAALNYQSAAAKSMNINPYVLGSSFCAILSALAALAGCIWYLGFLWGIIAFLFFFFPVAHATLGWLITIPLLLSKNGEASLRTVYFYINLFALFSIASLVFVIVSFFITPFEGLKTDIQSQSLNNYWIYLIILTVGFIIRVILSKILNRKYAADDIITDDVI